MFYLVFKKEMILHPDNTNTKGEMIVVIVIVLKANGEGKKWHSGAIAFVLT